MPGAMLRGARSAAPAATVSAARPSRIAPRGPAPRAVTTTSGTVKELYTAGTGNGQRAAIADNDCGVPCTMHLLHLAQGDQKKPDYLKINPTARIPTLIDPDGPAAAAGWPNSSARH
jgi:hypothetical protein